MNDATLLSVLNCCAPTDPHQRNCRNCPLRGERNCHDIMCSSAVAYIMSQRCVTERFYDVFDNISNLVNSAKSIS